MRPTKSAIRFSLELDRPDSSTCRVRLYDVTENDESHKTLIHEVAVSVEVGVDAQKRALMDTARFLHWYMTPQGGGL